jgi:hypothetical protein
MIKFLIGEDPSTREGLAFLSTTDPATVADARSPLGSPVDAVGSAETVAEASGSEPTEPPVACVTRCPRPLAVNGSLFSGLFQCARMSDTGTPWFFISDPEGSNLVSDLNGTRIA